MNAKATLLMLVLVPFALGAHPLSTNDDKKKNSTSPPPSARPQNSTAPRATSKAPNASAKAPSNRPGTTAGAIHPQPGRAPAPASQRPVNRAQLQQRMSVHPSQQDRMHAHESYKIERAHFTRHMDPIRFAPEHRLIPVSYTHLTLPTNR